MPATSPRHRVLILGLATAFLPLLSCSKDGPEKKISAWPRPTHFEGKTRAPLSSAFLEDAEIQEDEDEVLPAPRDAGNHEDSPSPDDAERPEERPCKALVEKLCELWTPYADSCVEAKAKTPDDQHQATKEACQALLEHYQSPDLRARRFPCSSLASQTCIRLGQNSEACVAAKGRVAVLKEAYQLDACFADLIWLEMATLRR